MAIFSAATELANSLKVLKSIRDSDDRTNTARIQATKAIKELLGKSTEKAAKPVETMSRAEIHAELARLKALTT